MADNQSFWDAISQFPGSKAQLGKILEEAPFGIYVDEPTRGCTYANRELLRQFGVTWKDFRGFGSARFVDPEDSERLRERIRLYETELEPIYVSYRVRGNEDRPRRWVHARVEPIVDAEGRHLGSIGVSVDRTAEQEFELRVARTQKLEAIGRHSARIAHDFNNLLTSMLFAVDVLERQPREEGSVGALKNLRHAADHARQLTGQLLTLTRHRATRQSSCRLGTEIRQLTPLLESVLGEGIEVRVELDAGDAQVPLDSGQIGQVVLNLATNGADAMLGYGVLEIRTKEDGSQALLEVEDHGTGMDEAVLAKALEPFFTTKEEGRGTGLGLSSVNDLVSLAGGSVTLESVPGRGTLARIALPISEASSTRLQQSGARAELSGEGLSVLLVEDQDSLRQSIAYALALEGFSVLGARSLAEARERLAETPRPDVLVTDVMLPDGRATGLVEELRRERRDLRLLYISGYAGASSREISADPGVKFLEKPFGLTEFLDVLAELLAD